MTKLKKIQKFYSQVRQEVVKIIWPGKSEVISSALIVFVVVLVFSLFFLFLDYGIYSIIRLLLNIGK